MQVQRKSSFNVFQATVTTTKHSYRVHFYEQTVGKAQEGKGQLFDTVSACASHYSDVSVVISIVTHTRNT